MATAAGASRVVNENRGDGVQHNYSQIGENNQQTFNVGTLQYNTTPDPNRALFMVPRSVNRLFTGRNDVLTRLCTHLDQAESDVEREEQTRIAITGIGGLGKSELCLKLIDIRRKRYKHTLWVDLGDLQAAEKAFISISRKLGFQPQSLEDAISDIASIQSWLLVLDNADDPNVDYSLFFPSGTQGTVIITSRNPECGRTYGRHYHEELDKLHQSHAVDLLLRSAHVMISSPYRLQAEEIVKRLQAHPLAIILAGSYIAKGHCRLEGYLKIYEENWRRPVSYVSSQENSRYGSVLSTFEASMAILMDDKNQVNSEVNSDALHMLHILSCLATTNVPFVIFEQAWQAISSVSKVKELNSVSDLSEWHIKRLPNFLKLVEDEWDSYRITEAYNKLEALSLITIVRSENSCSFSMHQLLHEWAWRRQDRLQMEQSWIMTGSTLSLSLWSGKVLKRHENEYIPHLRAYVTTWWSLSPVQNLAILQIMSHCAYALDEIRDDQLALRCLNTISTTLQKIGEADDDFHFIKRFARCRYRNGDFRGSVELFERLLELRKDIAEHHPDRLASQHELAVAYLADGQVAEAVALLEYVVKMQEDVLVERHPERLTSQHALAGAYLANGQVAEAVALFEHVVKVQESVLEERHPERLASHHALAGVYLTTGQVAEAVALFEHVVEMQESVLGERHPERLKSQRALARAYLITGQVAEGVALLEHVVEMEEDVLVERHPDRLASQYELARAYLANGQLAEAAALFEHVRDIKARGLP